MVPAYAHQEENNQVPGLLVHASRASTEVRTEVIIIIVDISTCEACEMAAKCLHLIVLGDKDIPADGRRKWWNTNETDSENARKCQE